MSLREEYKAEPYETWEEVTARINEMVEPWLPFPNAPGVEFKGTMYRCAWCHFTGFVRAQVEVHHCNHRQLPLPGVSLRDLVLQRRLHGFRT